MASGIPLQKVSSLLIYLILRRKQIAVTSLQINEVMVQSPVFFVCCVCGGGGVCVDIGFWLQSGICFGFNPGNWGHTAKRGYPQFLVRAVYSITGAIGCVKAPHLAIILATFW